MGEVSNKTLAILVLVSIVVSVVGLFAMLGGDGPTGFSVRRNSTGHGIINLTVSDTTYINVTDGFIDLGSLENNQTTDSDTQTDYIYLENDGTVKVNISVKYVTNMFTDPTGYCSPTFGIHSTTNQDLQRCFEVKADPTIEGGSAGSNMTTYRFMDTNQENQLASDLSQIDTKDQVKVWVQVSVPRDEPAGAKTGVLLFTATKSGEGDTA